MKVRDITFEDYGMALDHDQPCAVINTEPAVFNMRTGLFEPSRKAQSRGYYLVHAPKWWQRWLLKKFFGIHVAKYTWEGSPYHLGYTWAKKELQTGTNVSVIENRCSDPVNFTDFDRGALDCLRECGGL